ncbi:putative Unc104-like kinesin [Trypanosoma conorhini]|uniref:Putative Unc104-like kinesin n=1 Tax=Trypanosoma conorhini TaxID=83891 RepID=A0A422NCM2_9TRYP|nr:putative Unc104-like kinesin [Trypanosoma conorhini]RNF03225.1 putative Unc104-like kinesin [Trypanosoma conorhini]
MSMQRYMLSARHRESDTPAPPPRPPSRPRGGRPLSSGSATGRATPRGGGEAVHVVVRVRPPSPSESAQELVVTMDPSRGIVVVKDRMEGQRMFSVDMPVWSCVGKALDGSTPVTQSALYERVGRPLLRHALDGFNSTLVAYGQTGSGKTYTMMGEGGAAVTQDGEDVLNSSEEGIIPRLCRDMFQEIQSRSFTSATGETISWEVHVSFVEVYCEKISDLLNRNTPVTLRDDAVGNETYFSLAGARRVQVKNTLDILQALALGNSCRRTASTSMNERSNRSHAIFVVELTEILSFTDPDGEVASALSKSLVIRLVDLAGSERVGESGVSGQQFREGVDINLSLFTLGLVIESLSDPGRRNIKPPYRESTLTKILKDAFGGNSKTTMICTVAPAKAHRSETVQTLQYGARARHVVNRPHVEEDPSAIELRKANEELLRLRCQLSETQQGSRQYQDLVQQLERANKRLRQEQGLSRRRMALFAKKEEELATYFRKMEEERGRYDSRLQELAAEVERAKVKQQEKERQLRHAHRRAEELAEGHQREIQSQREAMERQFKCQTKNMLQKQQAAEERMQQLGGILSRRVDELVETVESLKKGLKRKERLAAQREKGLREETACRERELSRRLLEAKVLIERLQAKIAVKESDLTRRREASQDEAQARELKLREKLRKAEVQLQLHGTDAKKQCEEMSALYEKELAIQRQEVELQEMQQESEARAAERETHISRREEALAEQVKKVEKPAFCDRHSSPRVQSEPQLGQGSVDLGVKKLPVVEEEVEASDKGNAKTEGASRRRAQLEKTLAEREAALRLKKEALDAREGGLRRRQPQWAKEATALGPHASESAMAGVALDAEARSEAATMLEAELKTRLAMVDGDAENLAACLRLGEEALRRRELWGVDYAEGHARAALKRHEDGELGLIQRQMHLEGNELRVSRYERSVELLRQKHLRQHATWSSWVQEFFFAMQQRSRAMLESSRTGEYELLRLLEGAARASRLGTAQPEALAPAGGIEAHEAVSRAELQRREEALTAEQRRLTQRILSFKQLQQQREEDFYWKEEQGKAYLRELEAAGREQTAEHRRIEAELAAARQQLRRRESVLEGHVKRTQHLLKERQAAGEANDINTWERTEGEYIDKMHELLQGELIQHGVAGEGSQADAQNLLKLKEAELRELGAQMRRYIKQLHADEERWQNRVAAEEERMRMYLLSLEEDEYMDVPGEAPLGEAACQLLQDTEERERNLQRIQEQRVQQRAADLARRLDEAVCTAVDGERTLLDQESDLRAQLEKNEEVKRRIQHYERELQRQRRNYADLQKLLGDRERLLLREHAHRLSGKDSAAQLADDLLGANKFLQSQLEVWIRKYNVLKTDEKVECERCSWQNTRDAVVCRCCGNPQLV